jgi:hypothetical protein
MTYQLQLRKLLNPGDEGSLVAESSNDLEHFADKNLRRIYSRRNSLIKRKVELCF